MIMIVEDEELIRQGLTSLVDYVQFGMTVINQQKCREAWEKFQEQPLVDILSNWYQYAFTNECLDLAHLRQRAVSVLFIIFFDRLSDDFEFKVRKAIKLGADDYLLKPFSKMILKRC